MSEIDYSDVKLVNGVYQGVAFCTDWTTYTYYISPDGHPVHSAIWVRSTFEEKYIARFNFKRWK